MLAYSGRSSHWYWTGTGEVTIDFDGGVPFTAKTTRATRQAGEDVAVIRVTDTKSLIVEGWFGDGDELSVEEVAEAVVTAASVPDLRAQRPALERDRADSRQDARDAWRRVKIGPSLSRRAQKRLRQVLHQHWRAFTLRSVPPLMKGVCHRISASPFATTRTRNPRWNKHVGSRRGSFRRSARRSPTWRRASGPSSRHQEGRRLLAVNLHLTPVVAAVDQFVDATRTEVAALVTRTILARLGLRESGWCEVAPSARASERGGSRRGAHHRARSPHSGRLQTPNATRPRR